MRELDACDAKLALEALEVGLEPMPYGTRGWERLYQRVDDETSVADAQTVERANRLGLRRLGRFEFKTLLPRARLHYEAWTDPEEVVVFSMRDVRSSGPLVGRLSRYSLATWFEDGGFVITWSKSDPIMERDGDRWHRAGTGDLARDYASHRVAIERVADGRRALRVPDIETLVAIKRFFEVRRCPEATFRYVQNRMAAWVIPLIFLVVFPCLFLFLFLVRRH